MTLYLLERSFVSRQHYLFETKKKNWIIYTDDYHGAIRQTYIYIYI